MCRDLSSCCCCTMVLTVPTKRQCLYVYVQDEDAISLRPNPSTIKCQLQNCRRQRLVTIVVEPSSPPPPFVWPPVVESRAAARSTSNPCLLKLPKSPAPHVTSFHFHRIASKPHVAFLPDANNSPTRRPLCNIAISTPLPVKLAALPAQRRLLRLGHEPVLLPDPVPPAQRHEIATLPPPNTAPQSGRLKIGIAAASIRNILTASPFFMHPST
jgi:hypothetical protein